MHITMIGTGDVGLVSGAALPISVTTSHVCKDQEKIAALQGALPI